jgi:hypothetical protein
MPPAVDDRTTPHRAAGSQEVVIMSRSRSPRAVRFVLSMFCPICTRSLRDEAGNLREVTTDQPSDRQQVCDECRAVAAG